MKVYGDYHTHTTASDGKSTIDENVAAAQKRGLEAIAITDHAHYRAKQQRKRREHCLLAKAQTIKSGQERGVETLYGVECNIISTAGDIDVTNEERRFYDLVVCGFHVGARPRKWREFFSFYLPNLFWMLLHKMHLNWTPKGRIKKNTRVLVNAIEKNNLDILSHPNRYYRVDVLEVARACIARGTALELNNKRIDFRPIDFERMVAMGAKFVINSDAHKAENVGRMDRVESFLKLCEYKPDCILNLERPFVRPKAQLLNRIVEAESGNADQD